MKKIKPKTALAVGNRTDPYLTLGAGTVQSDRFWRWGDDNLFPAALALMSRRSTTHRRIMSFATKYESCYGFLHLVQLPGLISDPLPAPPNPFHT